jgi:hypothetical protein
VVVVEEEHEQELEEEEAGGGGDVTRGMEGRGVLRRAGCEVEEGQVEEGDDARATGATEEGDVAPSVLSHPGTTSANVSQLLVRVVQMLVNKCPLTA